MVKARELKMDVDSMEVGIKRKNDEESQTKSKKKSSEIGGRNPTQVLTSLYQGLEIEFTKIEENPPRFQAIAVIESMTFVGAGISKNKAKRELAIKALHTLKGFPLINSEDSVYPVPKVIHDDEKPSNEYIKSPGNFSSGLIDNLPTIDVEKVRHAPSMLLTQVFNGLELIYSDEGRGEKRYRVDAEIAGQKFFAEGRNKKLARLYLAKTVFLVFYNINNFVEEEVLDEAPSKNPTSTKKKFAVTQLKELVGTDMKVEVEEFVEDSGEKKYHASVVVQGTSYEAIGDTKPSAKLKASRKALAAIKPKTQVTEFLNAQGVDVGSHPSSAFLKHFPDVTFNETESTGSNGFPEFTMDVKINRRSFKVTASNKKKAKLRLILKVFEGLKKTSPSEWRNIDLDKILEDKKEM